MALSFLGLPCLHGDATIAPQDVPAVSGTVVSDTDGPDVAMMVLLRTVVMRYNRYIPRASGRTCTVKLRALQPEVAVIKVMSIPDNSCIRIVIPDDNVGVAGFHEVLIQDLADADVPYVGVEELGFLRQNWPKVIFSSMGRHQVDLEHLHHDCRERYSGANSGLCPSFGNFIQKDLGRHVASFHLELAQQMQCGC